MVLVSWLLEKDWKSRVALNWKFCSGRHVTSPKFYASRREAAHLTFLLLHQLPTRKEAFLFDLHHDDQHVRRH